MRISPMEIRQQRFTVKAFRGFDPQEVDAFLDDVAEDYEALLKENTLLKEQLQALEERARGHEARERILQETLITTQRLTEQMKEAAKREAGLVVREAEISAEKLLEGARAEEAAIRARIGELQRTRLQFLEGLRATVESYQRLIARDAAGQPREEPAG
jgi:cell division initiation protein